LYRDLLRSAQFFGLLLKIDKKAVETTRAARCPCGGPLHVGDFERKPRGLLLQPDELPEGYRMRFDLCCGWCRKRTMPASVRFLGRKVYWAAAVVVATVIAHRSARDAMRLVQRELGVSSSTVACWRRWWRALTGMAYWVQARGRLPVELDVEAIPASLLSEYAGHAGERMVRLLQWVQPFTARIAPEQAI